MSKYLIEWLHLYSIHFGIVTAILLLLDIYINGLPDSKLIASKLKSAVILAAALALFSSHAHNHALFHLIKEIK